MIAQGRIADECYDGGDEIVYVACPGQQTVDAVNKILACLRSIGCDHRYAAGHRFDDDVGHAVLTVWPRGIHEHAGPRQLRTQLVLCERAEQPDV